MWVGAMSTSHRAVTPCSWRVKAGMVRVWVAGKTTWFPRYTWPYLRDKRLTYKVLYKFICLLYFAVYNCAQRKHTYMSCFFCACLFKFCFVYVSFARYSWLRSPRFRISFFSVSDACFIGLLRALVVISCRKLKTHLFRQSYPDIVL